MPALTKREAPPQMRVGMATVFQNPFNQRPDLDVYRDEAQRNMRLFAEQVAPRPQALAPVTAGRQGALA